jgi:signal transduction histidine kinase
MSIKTKLAIIFVMALLASAALILILVFALLLAFAIGNSLGDGSSLSDVVLAGRPAFFSVLADLRAIIKQSGEFVDEFSVLLAILAVAVIASMAAVFLVFVKRFVTEPLTSLRDAARRIADGDLDHVIQYEYADEIGAICKTLEKMRVALKESISDRLQFEDARKMTVAAISHDLRTPITTVKGYVEGILDGVASTDEKRDAYLRTVLSKTDELEKIIDDLLIFTKMDMEREIYSFEDVNLRQYLSEAVDEIRRDGEGRLIDGKEAAFSFEDAAGCDVMVSMDAGRFRRVLANLAGNAIKYHNLDDGGKISVLTRLTQNRGNAVIEVRDNGIGIDERDIQKIFDVFFMSDRSRGKAGKSYGLGLAIAKEIVTAHGGKIWARSTQGAGTSVFVSLPKKGGEA